MKKIILSLGLGLFALSPVSLSAAPRALDTSHISTSSQEMPLEMQGRGKKKGWYKQKRGRGWGRGGRRW